MRTCIIALMVSLLLPINGLAQSDKYVVLTFSVKRNIDKIPWEYIWVVPYDSISNDYRNGFRIVPFAVDDLKEMDLLDNKCKCLDMDRFVQFFCANVWDDSPSLDTIKKNRKLIQTKNVKWPQYKAYIKIKVFATPIQGNIKYCEQLYLKGYNLYYTEEILKYWPDFWETTKAKGLMEADYSNIEYDLKERIKRR